MARAHVIRVATVAMFKPLEGVEQKYALVSLVTMSGLRTRVVKFTGSVNNLWSAILESFNDLLQHLDNHVITLQVRDDSWGDKEHPVFVDLIDEECEIPDRSVVYFYIQKSDRIQAEVCGGSGMPSVSTQSVSFPHNTRFCVCFSILFKAVI